MLHRIVRHTAGQNRSAIAAVEFAVVLPFLVILLAGVWEVGALVEAQQVLNNAARVGGRQASTGLNTNTDVQTAVTQYVQRAGLPTTNLSVTVTDVTSGGDVSNATQMDQIQVTVTIPFSDVAWDVLNYLVPAGSQLSATSTWYSMKDQPVTVSTTLPIQ